MLQQQTLKCLIIFIIIVKCVYSLEIFASETKDNEDENVEDLGSFRDKPYEIPLFQTRYITIRTDKNDFRRNTHNTSDVIGFKFQITCTVPDIVKIEKEVMVSEDEVKTNDLNNVLFEDLYISRRKGALGHIFNAYPSPTLIRLKQNSINDLAINSRWSIEGVTMDVTNVTIRFDVFYDDDNAPSSHIWPLNILVTQPKRRIDTIFYIIIPCMVITISVLMGTLLDTTVIFSIIKKPVPVLVGFVAQYGLMPWLAVAIAKIFRYTPLNSLALFVIGCCPGSGASNQWTIIFDGDVNLSAIMSFVSTAASFFMMPLYFYTLGRLYMDELSIRIPFIHLARSLAMVVIPYGIGILISHFVPKSRPFVEKLMKPMMLVLLLFFMTFGVVVNWYLFKMIDLYTTLTAPLLPFLGFLFGAILAKICRLEWKYVKTIGIEAGIQNVGIAFMIFMYSFPQPYATKAMIVPMVVAFLTTKPFWIIYIIRNQVQKYQKKKKSKKSNIDEKMIKSNGKSSLNNEENHVAEATVLHVPDFGGVHTSSGGDAASFGGDGGSCGGDGGSFGGD